MIRFQKHFPEVLEKIEARYRCAYQDDILLQGFLYLTRSRFCFSSTVLGRKVTINVPWQQVEDIRKAKIAFIFPTAIALSTSSVRYVFASFLQRDNAYNTIKQIIFPIGKSLEVGFEGDNNSEISFKNDDSASDDDDQDFLEKSVPQIKYSPISSPQSYSSSSDDMFSATPNLNNNSLSTFTDESNRSSSVSGNYEGSSSSSEDEIQSTLKKPKPVLEVIKRENWFELFLFAVLILMVVSSSLINAKVTRLEKLLLEYLNY